MARSQTQLTDQLRQRLAHAVRPGAPVPPLGAMSEEVRPRHAVNGSTRPPVLSIAAASGHAASPTDHVVDESVIRTVLRAPDPAPEPISAPTTASFGDQSPVALGRRVLARLPAFDRPHLAVIMVLLTLAVVVGGWLMLRARDHAAGAEVPPATVSPAVSESVTPSPTSPGVPSAGASPGPSTSAAPTIRIHVVGAVRRPGVVSLPDGARVADALAAAGGLAAGAIPGRLNLAQTLHDGEQVFVSRRAEPSSEVVGAGGGTGSGEGGASGTVGQSKVDLNSATSAQLETLPGVGPATAQAILAWREEHGRFSRIEELQEVDGIGPKTFARLAPYVTL